MFRSFNLVKEGLQRVLPVEKLKTINMPDQDPLSHNQHQQPTPATSPAPEKKLETDEEFGVGENEENHTSGGYIHYEGDSESSPDEAAGQDGKNIHTDNHGGTADE